MTGPGRLHLAVGGRLVYDGQQWDVVEMAASRVVLSAVRGGGRRQVDVGHLLATPSTRMVDAAEQPPTDGAGAALANLGDDERRRLGERVAHVREVLTGYRHGSEELALPGEPRADYAGTPMLRRYAAKAAELDVGVSTLRRWVSDFRDGGPVGLIDGRRHRGQDRLAGIDLRWLHAARTVLAENVEASTPTQNLVLAKITAQLEGDHGAGGVPPPSNTRARAALRELSRGTSAFGGAKARREIASRPQAPYGRLRPMRPGEYLLVDTTRLDVFAMDPVTLRWVQCEVTIALDLYDRCVTGLRLTPVSTKAVDAAAILYESVRPLPEPAAGWVDVRGPYHGLPGAVVVNAHQLVDAAGEPLLPSVAAETLIVDHGKIYLSEHLLSVCQRLGISVQPARVYQGSDKAAVERFFRTLREQLLVALPGYKGPDVYHRGKDVESDAFYFLDELEQIIRRWVAECYHRQPHSGLTVPEVPGLALSPLEMFAHGIARAGAVRIPARPDLVFDFLKVEWRTIQHYGVEIGGLRYDGSALTPYRNTTSPFTGPHAGRWPIRVDPGDVSKVYFQDPADHRWHALRWERADEVDGPFSSEALGYARQLAAATQRFPDTARELAELLDRWGAGLAGNRAERRMALRLSEQRLRLIGDTEPEPAAAQPALVVVAADDDGLGGEDDTDEELAAPFPGERTDAGVGERDFYAEAMEVG